MRATPAALTDAAVWASWGTLVGVVAARTPDARFAADGAITRIRRWERRGRTWERLGVRRWKHLVPDLGPLFGGRSKRRLGGRTPRALEHMVIETRRAELVHWLAPVPVVVMPWWNPGWLLLVMIGYAVVANVPCVVIQRHTRARLQHVLARATRAGRSTT